MKSFILIIMCVLSFYTCSEQKNKKTINNKIKTTQKKSILSQTSISKKSFDPKTGHFLVDQKTLALWRFERLKRDFLIDLSPFENYILSPNTKLVPSRFGKGVLFDGEQFYLEVESTKSLNVRKAITVELWVLIHRDQTMRYPVIISKDSISTGAGKPVYEISFNNSPDDLQFSKIAWRIATVKQEYILHADISWKSLADSGKWIYFAMTYDQNIMKFHLNGQLITSMKAQGKLIETSYPLRIGRKYTENKNLFRGVIDELRLSNIARSSEEIKQYWNSQQ